MRKKTKVKLFVAGWAIAGVLSTLLRTYVETPFVSNILFPVLLCIEFISLIVIIVYAVQRAEETINKR